MSKRLIHKLSDKPLDILFVFYSIRFVILFTLIPRVETLCKRADVAGGRIPATPRAMSIELNPITKR